VHNMVIVMATVPDQQILHHIKRNKLVIIAPEISDQ